MSLLDDLLALGHRQLSAGKCREAEAVFQDIVRRDPDNAMGHYLLGSARLQLGHGGEAIGPFRRAVRLAPDSAEAYNGLGAALLAAGHRRESEQAYQTASQLDPTNVNVWLNLGEQYLQERRFAEARAAFEQASILAPRDPRIESALVQLVEAKTRGRGRGPGYPQISVVVHTRNDEAHLEDCLRCLLWADELLVADMASTDGTVELARRYADRVMSVPSVDWVECSRPLGVAAATYDWVFFVDPDERIPFKLVRPLSETMRHYGDRVDGYAFPMKWYYLGKWIRNKTCWPGYPFPRLLNRRRFEFTGDFNEGTRAVDENVVIKNIPYTEPACAIDHYTVTSLSGHLEKINRYTTGGLVLADRAGRRFHWRTAAAKLAREISRNLDQPGEGYQNSSEDLIRALLHGFNDLLVEAKLYEERARTGRLEAGEEAAPLTARQFIEEMLRSLPEPMAPPAGAPSDLAKGTLVD